LKFIRTRWKNRQDIKKFCIDNAKEYLSKEFIHFLQQEGIKTIKCRIKSATEWGSGAYKSNSSGDSTLFDITGEIIKITVDDDQHSSIHTEPLFFKSLKYSI